MKTTPSMREEIVIFNQKGLGYEAALMRNQRSASAGSPFFSRTMLTKRRKR